jgi:hypothetical protein
MLCGIVILGLLYGVGEFGSGWIEAQDRVTDALWKRVFTLLALFTFWATLFWAVAALSTLLRGRPIVLS